MNKVSKYFATNPKKSSFVKACQDMASQILGDRYDDETTIKTAEGIWEDYSGDTFDAKLGIFRNGLKGYNKTKEESDHNRSFSDEEWYVVEIYSPISPVTYRAMRKSDADNEVKRSSSSKLAYHGVSRIVEGPFESYKEALKVQKEYNANKYLSDNSEDDKYREAYERYKDYGYSNRSFSITRDNETYYGQLIGTLLQSAVIAHLYHFQTSCRWCHTDVEKYYKNIVELLDELCEGILEPLDMDLIYSNVIDQKATPVDYFEELKAFCQDMKQQLFGLPEDSNYASIMDDIINLISKTLYRLKRFNYYKGESEQLTEGNVSFSKKSFSEPIYLVSYYANIPKAVKVANIHIDEFDDRKSLDKFINDLADFGETPDRYEVGRKNEIKDLIEKLKKSNTKLGIVNIIDHTNSLGDLELLSMNSMSEKSFSDSNGVKPAPQRFAVIFISKDHKLDCNASYKEADQDAIDCFVPEGGYGVLDGKKYLDNLELNRMVPKCDCEAKIVPVAKVKIRGRIGHSSASL